MPSDLANYDMYSDKGLAELLRQKVQEARNIAIVLEKRGCNRIFVHDYNLENILYENPNRNHGMNPISFGKVTIKRETTTVEQL